MCYSAEVEEDWKKFLRVTGADMSIRDITPCASRLKCGP